MKTIDRPFRPRKESGRVYTDILIALIIIEMIALTLLASIVVSTHANMRLQRTISSYRIAESVMEDTVQRVMSRQISAPYSRRWSSPQGGEYVYEVEVSNAGVFLKEISVRVSHSVPQAAGGRLTGFSILERLVAVR